MALKAYATEEIIKHFRTMEIEKAKNKSMEEIARSVGGLQLDQAHRLKELEKENGRLKRLVADQALDNNLLHMVSLAIVGLFDLETSVGLDLKYDGSKFRD